MYRNIAAKGDTKGGGAAKSIERGMAKGGPAPRSRPDKLIKYARRAPFGLSDRARAAPRQTDRMRARYASPPSGRAGRARRKSPSRAGETLPSLARISCRVSGTKDASCSFSGTAS